jgi:hypothetical protein
MRIDLPVLLAMLAETHGKVGQVAEGFQVLAEATAVIGKIVFEFPIRAGA